ncbi:MAG: hypothetical protein J0M03_04380 [Acidobacteria bacterium]|nr:hypothetical protein [Acidobacteriota bacterium]
MNSQNRVWLKATAVLIVVFCLGIITGGALDSLYRSQAKSVASKNNKIDTTDYLNNLKRELNLSPEQVRDMQIILSDMSKDYKILCAETSPRYSVLREKGRSKMKGLLSTDQQKLFDQVVTQEDCNCPYLKK